MAIPPFHGAWDDPFDFTVKETIIQGKLVVAEYHYEDFLMVAGVPNQLHEREVKEELARYLAHRMVENNLLNFTKQPNVSTGRTIYRAYGYMVPNDHIQLLREAKIK
jgi:hypothetical protein